MAWIYPKRFNFRGTAGFVTDGTNETYVLGTSTPYPTTRTINGESVTFGWESGPDNNQDRTTSSPWAPELSGINFSIGSNTATFRIDLPVAGSYQIVFAGGDEQTGYESYVEFVDGTTVLATIGAPGIGLGIGLYMDAMGNTGLTAAAWQGTTPNGGALYSATFATTICRLVLLGVNDFNIMGHFGVIPQGSAPSNSASIAWING